MKYTITLNYEQLRILRDATEEYFRLRMGQFFDLSMDLAAIMLESGYTKEEFNQYIEAKEEFQSWCEHWFRRRIGSKAHKTDEINGAIDIWHVIEHQQWLDSPNRGTWDRASAKPFPFGPEPLMEIKRVEE